MQEALAQRPEIQQSKINLGSDKIFEARARETL